MLKAEEPIILGFDLSGGVECQQAAAHLTAEPDWDPRLVFCLLALFYFPIPINLLKVFIEVVMFLPQLFSISWTDLQVRQKKKAKESR